VLDHAERHAAEQPGHELATARGAEHDQIRSPLGGLGDDLLGNPPDEGGANLPRGRDARHAQLEDGRLDDFGGRGISLQREAPSPGDLARIEVQDAGLAHAGSPRQLHHVLHLAGVRHGYQHAP